MAITVDTAYIYINNFTKVKQVVRNTTLLIFINNAIQKYKKHKKTNKWK